MKIYRNKKGSSPAPDAAPPAATDEAPTEATTATPKNPGKGAKPKPESETPPGEMVTIIKTGNAAKLSPRGDGALTFQVGRIDDTIHLRIFRNESAGRFSREWVAVEAIRSALAKLPKGQPLFKAAVGLKPAWKGRSSCNSGFGAAILKSEGVFVSDAEKKGMMRLAVADALDKWEQAMLALKVPKGAEQVPLFPPKPASNFSPREKSLGIVKGAGRETASSDQSDKKLPREDVDPQAAQGESELENEADADTSTATDAAPESGDES